MGTVGTGCLGAAGNAGRSLRQDIARGILQDEQHIVGNHGPVVEVVLPVAPPEPQRAWVGLPAAWT